MKTQGMTVLYWRDGNKLKEYLQDAWRMGCKFYEGEQFDVLFNKEGQIIASYIPNNVVGIEDHNLSGDLV